VAIIFERPLVSIIVPNWNGKNVLRTCLNSLENLTYPNYEVIVVDNGSTDGSKEMITKEFPRVRLVANSRNLGFAGGCNLGVKFAKGDIIALVNNDATAKPSWLTKLVETVHQGTNVGVVGGVIFYDNPGDILWSSGARIDLISGIDWRVGHGKRLSQAKTVGDIDYLPGTALVFPRKLLYRAGLFDENYFFYCEDLDWTLCVRRLGYSCKLNPSAIVWHKASMSRRKMQLQGYYHQMRGLFRVYFKHFPLRYLVTSLFFQLVIFPIFEPLFFGTSPLFTLQRIRAFAWNLTKLKETIIERYEANSMGKLKLKNRFREFLSVAKDHALSKNYDF